MLEEHGSQSWLHIGITWESPQNSEPCACSWKLQSHCSGVILNKHFWVILKQSQGQGPLHAHTVRQALFSRPAISNHLLAPPQPQQLWSVGKHIAENFIFMLSLKVYGLLLLQHVLLHKLGCEYLSRTSHLLTRASCNSAQAGLKAQSTGGESLNGPAPGSPLLTPRHRHRQAQPRCCYQC